MPRHARQLSTSGIYHIMFRGNEKKDIFIDDEDKLRFMDTLQRMKLENEYEVYAYCIMDNHVHILLKVENEPVERSIKRICVSYAYYFNKKYSRVGHLFQDRYRSENIEDDKYLTACVRYIHNNPVKAGIVNQASEYRWSSYNQYVGMKKGLLTINKEFMLDIFSNNREKAVDDNFIEYSDRDSGKSKDIITDIMKVLEINMVNLEELVCMSDKKRRSNILRQIKASRQASIRDLAKMIGISKDIIFRA